MPQTQPARLIAHMDCDAFYYSVECLRDPSLVGKAVIVAGSGPRAVVTTASYEARKYGVGSAMPAAKAKRMCPHAIVIPTHFDLYRAKSKGVWDIVKEDIGREMQHISLDEGYIDLTGIDNAVIKLGEVIARVKEETGIVVSVGIGPNKLVAKCCSDYDKPAGFTAMTRTQACHAFAPKSARILPGIGPATAQRLLGLGVGTIGHLQTVSQVALIEEFGTRRGKELKNRANFIDDSPLETSRIAKSRSNEHTFDEDITDVEFMKETLKNMAAGLSVSLKERGKRGRTIGIKIRLDDWTTVTRDRSVERFVDDEETIAKVALELFEEYNPARPVRLLGVKLSAFEDVVGPMPEKKPPKVKVKVKVNPQLTLPFG